MRAVSPFRGVNVLAAVIAVKRGSHAQASGCSLTESKLVISLDVTGHDPNGPPRPQPAPPRESHNRGA
jgi:hypothetical protein